jgi:hypothetical protein
MERKSTKAVRLSPGLDFHSLSGKLSPVPRIAVEQPRIVKGGTSGGTRHLCLQELTREQLKRDSIISERLVALRHN